MPSSNGYQTNLFGTDLLLQLNPNDPLLVLARAIPCQELERELGCHYCPGIGTPALPIKLMTGLLLLKQVEDINDHEVVLDFKRNPYYQAFCGLTEFSLKPPCDSYELAKFRTRIGAEGINRIFEVSILLQGKAALEDTVNIDTPGQEKNITYPTDGKLAIKIIKRLNKLAKAYGIQQAHLWSRS